ncbi:AraC family transcriptional regulator [Rhodococcus sp. CSLK01-03]|uniref:AraC family transcriptional regulator n=1 Tax=Rhodococcus indonesiensis TaxID=3055869 RepID=A0ABT7RIW4_9NOCA|nr:AraC family transcriptional regulator [Rhodococcus indonesiensis]MDM7487576.1 AraC family transcriptional regulator [Rhodococcus indonesiensis]
MTDVVHSLDPFSGRGSSPATVSTDWDEIRAWSDRVYMPYRVRPSGRLLHPRSSMFSASIGDIVLTRFRYGIPVTVDRLSAEAGNILVLTTIRGHARHRVGAGAVEVDSGATFVADCSRIEHRVDFDDDHLQLNLTVPHRLVADLADRWFGVVPDDRLWQHKCVVGTESGWNTLLAYAVRAIRADPVRIAQGRPGAHLQELLLGHLVTEWAAAAGVALDCGEPPAAPAYVRHAEHYIREHAADLPTVSEVAAAVGVSVRALSGAFRRHLDTTPNRYLTDVRLRHIRDELSTPSAECTVSAVAARWGYVNMGVFAAAYRRRFGENPSHTLARARGRRLPESDDARAVPRWPASQPRP